MGDDPYADVRKWQQYLSQVTEQALKEQNAFEKLKWQAARDDASKALRNSMNIAKLQAETSRYGTDAQREVSLKQLKENARQFDLKHGLEQQEFGLNVADTYTKYAQTYDDIWALQDFKGTMASIQQGGGPLALGSQGTPQPKSWESFAALAGFGGMPGVARSAADGGGGNGQPTAAAPAGGGGSGTDQRLSAANAVMKALPPSEGMGNTEQDWAALNAIQSLYFGAKPGQVEQLGAERQKIAMGGLARLGYNPKLVDEERRRSLPGQGSARAY